MNDTTVPRPGVLAVMREKNGPHPKGWAFFRPTGRSRLRPSGQTATAPFRARGSSRAISSVPNDAIRNGISRFWEMLFVCQSCGTAGHRGSGAGSAALVFGSYPKKSTLPIQSPVGESRAQSQIINISNAIGGSASSSGLTGRKRSLSKTSPLLLRCSCFLKKEHVKIANEERLSLLTIKQVAETLRVCRRTLEREISRGRFPRPVKIGSASRWTASDLQAYVDLLQRERGTFTPSP